jgi:hypothetical protein
MEWSLIVEAEAADWFEFDQDVTVQRIGFGPAAEHSRRILAFREVNERFRL